MVLRISSIWSDGVKVGPASANRLYLRMMRSRLSRVMTRCLITSMRSSAYEGDRGLHQIGRDLLRFDQDRPVDR